MWTAEAHLKPPYLAHAHIVQSAVQCYKWQMPIDSWDWRYSCLRSQWAGGHDEPCRGEVQHKRRIQHKYKLFTLLPNKCQKLITNAERSLKKCLELCFKVLVQSPPIMAWQYSFSFFPVVLFSVILSYGLSMDTKSEWLFDHILHRHVPLMSSSSSRYPLCTHHLIACM